MTRLLNGMIPDFYDGTLDGQIRVKGFDPVNCSMYEISKSRGNRVPKSKDTVLYRQYDQRNRLWL